MRGLVGDHIVYLGLGANLGRPAQQLRQAIGRLGTLGEVEAVSSLYGSEPEGGAAQPEYRNAVVRLRTALSPSMVLDGALAIEKEFGRRRSTRNASRTLDIDLLSYDDRVIHTPELTVPHPRLHLRPFVLAPLCEIAPDWVHPVSGSTVGSLLEQVSGSGRLTRLDWAEAQAPLTTTLDDDDQLR